MNHGSPLPAIFYYGHLYASLCIKKLPENEQPEFKEKLSEILIPLQEKDGSWWDFPFYNYHKQYGTAMALISLANCKKLNFIKLFH